jgi:Tol biopolymer transport system component
MGATRFDEGIITLRILYLIVCLLTAEIGFSQVSRKQTSGCVGCFSEPQSTLLFSPPGGDTNDGDYTLVAPSGSFTVPQLSGPMDRASPNWAISPLGDQVAGGITFMLNADVVKCDPQIKGWCDPKPEPIFKSVLGVYSVRDKTWKQYGDFVTVGSAAFSPDGKSIAFDAEKSCGGVNCDSDLTILDLETGEMSAIPGRIHVDWRNQISWSPDGKFLAATDGSGSGKIVSDHIVLVDVATGEMKTIAEGTDPSWSPKGDWIAYILTVQCMVIHPDGSGARSVLEKERKWMKDALDDPILWSPDGERLLLNQRKIFGGHPRVIMVDLATGHVIIKSKEGELVTGWVPHPDK